MFFLGTERDLSTAHFTLRRRCRLHIVTQGLALEAGLKAGTNRKSSFTGGRKVVSEAGLPGPLPDASQFCFCLASKKSIGRTSPLPIGLNVGKLSAWREAAGGVPVSHETHSCPLFGNS